MASVFPERERFASGSEVAGMPLRPRRRAMNRATVRPNGNCFGQLASARQIAWDVLVVCGYCAEFLAWTFMRIEHDNRFAHAFLEIVKRSDKIGVARDKDDAIEVGLYVVDEHLRSDIHIRSLFFRFPHGRTGNLVAGFARLLCKGIAGAKTLVITLDYRQLRAIRRKSGKIYSLPHLRGRLCGIVVDAGGKILYGDNFVFVWAWQKGVGERDDIQPFIARKAEQSVIEVESVYIYDSLFYRHLSKRQGPDFRPAPHRIAEAQRSVINPSRGSVCIVANFRLPRNGACAENAFRGAIYAGKPQIDGTCELRI